MPVGRRSLTKTSCKSALPLFLTSRVKVTLVPGEPEVGLAVLVTDIFDSRASTSAESSSVTLLPLKGLPETSTWLVRVWVPLMELSMSATICTDLFSPDNRGPMLDQETVWPTCDPPEEDET